MKYDPNGNQLWVQTFRGPGSWFNRPNAIAVDSSNNVYVDRFDLPSHRAAMQRAGTYGSISTTHHQVQLRRRTALGRCGTWVGGSGVDDTALRLLWTPREMCM